MPTRDWIESLFQVAVDHLEADEFEEVREIANELYDLGEEDSSRFLHEQCELRALEAKADLDANHTFDDLQDLKVY